MDCPTTIASDFSNVDRLAIELSDLAISVVPELQGAIPKE